MAQLVSVVGWHACPAVSWLMLVVIPVRNEMITVQSEDEEMHQIDEAVVAEARVTASGSLLVQGI